MELFDRYKDLEKELHGYFGYVEDWVVIPMDNCSKMYWSIIDGNRGTVRFADDRETLIDKDAIGSYYQEQIYTQRFLPKWVYRGENYTMISCDTQTDGNKFLRIFDNNLEVAEDDLNKDF